MNATKSEPNETPHVEDWAGEMGERWLAQLDRFEKMIEPIGNALLEQAAFRAGEAVVDIGAGGGATTRAIASAIAPEGTVVGLDISSALVAEAERRSHGFDNVQFVCGDAASAQLAMAPFDRLFSRFGSMFFDDPYSAFVNLKAMLKPGARIDLAVWGPPRENPWMMEMIAIVRRHVEVPPAEPRAPGPFAFEDLGYLGDILARAGFENMDVVPYAGSLAVGGRGTPPEDALAFVHSSLGVGRILGEQDEDTRSKASRDLLDLFDARHVPVEGVVMQCKAWLVSAAA